LKSERGARASERDILLHLCCLEIGKKKEFDEPWAEEVEG
jgi:hypothetical protein